MRDPRGIGNNVLIVKDQAKPTESPPPPRSFSGENCGLDKETSWEVISHGNQKRVDSISTVGTVTSSFQDANRSASLETSRRPCQGLGDNRTCTSPELNSQADDDIEGTSRRVDMDRVEFIMAMPSSTGHPRDGDIMAVQDNKIFKLNSDYASTMCLDSGLAHSMQSQAPRGDGAEEGDATQDVIEISQSSTHAGSHVADRLNDPKDSFEGTKTKDAPEDKPATPASRRPRRLKGNPQANDFPKRRTPMHNRRVSSALTKMVHGARDSNSSCKTAPALQRTYVLTG